MDETRARCNESDDTDSTRLDSTHRLDSTDATDSIDARALDATRRDATRRDPDRPRTHTRPEQYMVSIEPSL